MNRNALPLAMLVLVLAGCGGSASSQEPDPLGPDSDSRFQVRLKCAPTGIVAAVTRGAYDGDPYVPTRECINAIHRYGDDLSVPDLRAMLLEAIDDARFAECSSCLEALYDELDRIESEG